MNFIAEKVRQYNLRVSRDFTGTAKYWMRSPSNILLYKATHEALKRFAKGTSVLDAGAGKLAYRDILKKYFSKYTSSDFAKTHPELDVVSDIEEMPFDNGSFDAIFCSQVLEHVPHPWIALPEMRRILKKGGVIIITVPMFGYIHNAPYDFYRYTEFGLKSLASEAKLSIEYLKPLGGFFCFLGYIRSTFLMPLFGIPLVGMAVLYGNYLLSYLDILLDVVTNNQKIFPLNYLVVLKKKA